MSRGVELAIRDIRVDRTLLALRLSSAGRHTQRDEAVSRLLAARFHGSSEHLRASSLPGR
ncbi:hypothetical protein ASC87_29880 [Rhizobacter sp. Root1221]|nr:hypothetical protein ASC87_29880 [Rhizobacter sp. Root1221]